MEKERGIRNKTIGTAVTATEKAAFESFCADRNISPSKMVRLMLSKVCPGDIAPGNSEERNNKETPLYLRLEKKDVANIRQRAQRESTTAQGWIRKRIRAELHKIPPFNRDEEKSLLQSNRELTYIGRNINQIAIQLNISLNATDLFHAKELEKLVNEIRDHREKVSALINASWGRFGGS